MDLFRTSIDQPKNMLPQDGVAKYYGILIPITDADRYYSQLLSSIEWKRDEAIMFGKHIVTKRKVAWYADEPYEYRYSNTTKRALPWTKELLELKALVEDHLDEPFNSCLLNLYNDGSEGMDWHSDAERELKRNAAIASLSFGAERKFSFKHKTSKETLSVVLEHGSLLVMSGTTQSYWQHRLPPTKTIHQPRVNLTFRLIE